MAKPIRLDLTAIEASLYRVQANFEELNAQLTDPRDPLSDQVISNIMDGYGRVDCALAEGVDLFALGNSKLLLDLNAVVLFGGVDGREAEHRSSIEATERKFYDDQNGGIGDLMRWWERHGNDSPWERAAGVYVRVLSTPQLYIEGNHRTGALIMSYILARDGRPPFVLSVENARAYFDPSSVIKKTRKDGIGLLFRIPGMKKRFASFLHDHANNEYIAAT